MATPLECCRGVRYVALFVGGEVNYMFRDMCKCGCGGGGGINHFGVMVTGGGDPCGMIGDHTHTAHPHPVCACGDGFVDGGHANKVNPCEG